MKVSMLPCSGSYPLLFPMAESYGMMASGESTSINSSHHGRGGGPPSQIFHDFPMITSSSPKMARILNEAKKFAQSQSCILIQGESGTGKELMASSIHKLSSRADQPFITLNCSAIHEGVLESELFGHVKGAFTGAEKTKEGFFSLARGGTLFLDEIGDMPLRLQAKLLRVLQNQTYHPVGSTEICQTDVRIIAATNVDLALAVKKKRFRLDLYYRLNVLPIEIPPLRERLEDLALLVSVLIKKADAELCSASTHKTTSITHVITDACLDRLKLYPWPGNIRELENLMMRMVISQDIDGPLDVVDLPTKYQMLGCDTQKHSLVHSGMPTYYWQPNEPTSEDRHHTTYQRPIDPRQQIDDDVKNLPHSDYRDHLTEMGDGKLSDGLVRHGAYRDPGGLRGSELSYSPPIGSSQKKFFLHDITHSLTLPAAGINLTEDMKNLEKHLIDQALAVTGQNKNKAAHLLGIKRTTLVEKIKKIKNSAMAGSKNNGKKTAISSVNP
ncbi:MAG: sigma 54-interacting transcriptional regulator [Proteobacteria bacterium]|nr:sigma 54-interacting transcriptional regulator [Pseudomonadota bacterium]